MQSVKFRHSVYLLLAALFWGTTFVAQSMAMETLQPFTYNACRFLLGTVVVLPMAILTGRSDSRSVNFRGNTVSGKNAAPVSGVSADGPAVLPPRDRILMLLKGGLMCGTFLFIAGGFQQVGIVYTTAGKSGFITALYIVLVPVFGLFLHKKCSPLIIVSIALAVAGLYLLCIREGFSVNRGDVITLGSAVSFAFHILTVDRYSPRVSGVQLSCLQFLTAGLLSLIPAFVLETPQIGIILRAWGPIAYAGVLSCGVAYTLQILGQRGLNPSLAALIMSLESCISALAGWIVLGDSLCAKELSGCVLMFTAIILAQLPSPARTSGALHRRRTTA